MESSIYESTDLTEVESHLASLEDINSANDEGLTALHQFVAFNSSPEVISVVINSGGSVFSESKMGLTPLHVAAACNHNPEIIRELVNAKAPVNVASSSGLTPLHGAAAYNPNPEVATELINGGAEIDRVSKSDMTPLFAAAANNKNPEIIRTLVENGSDANRRNDGSDTPLHAVAQINPNPEATRILIDAGAESDAVNSDGLTPLHLAASSNPNPEVVSNLLAAGAGIGITDKDGKLPCERALESNSALVASDVYKALSVVHQDNWGSKKFFLVATLEDVKRCLRNGAEVNIRVPPNSLTPLHWAVRCNPHLSVIEALLDEGADVNATERTGLTPLHWAVQNPYIPSAIVTLLVDRGADLEAQVKDTAIRPLEIAVRNASHPDVVETLIKLGSSVENGETSTGVAIIHRAATNTNCPAEVISVLVANGADPLALDKMENSAIHLTFKTNKIFLKAIQKLVELGLDPNSQNSHGNTPLHKIVRMNSNNAALDFMIKSGADPYLENNKGKSPFDIASDSVKRNIRRKMNKFKGSEANAAPTGEEVSPAEEFPPNDTDGKAETADDGDAPA